MKRNCNWFKWRGNVIDLDEKKMQLIKMKRKCNWFKWRGIVIDLNEEEL